MRGCCASHGNSRAPHTARAREKDSLSCCCCFVVVFFSFSFFFLYFSLLLFFFCVACVYIHTRASLEFQQITFAVELSYHSLVADCAKGGLLWTSYLSFLFSLSQMCAHARVCNLLLYIVASPSDVSLSLFFLLRIIMFRIYIVLYLRFISCT